MSSPENAGRIRKLHTSLLMWFIYTMHDKTMHAGVSNISHRVLFLSEEFIDNLNKKRTWVC